MRYIIFEDFGGHPVPFIFPERIDYEELREQIPYARVLSAGRVVLAAGRFQCSGEAPELAAKARPEDAELITKAFADAPQAS